MTDAPKTLDQLKADKTRVATELTASINAGDFERAEELGTELETIVASVNKAQTLLAAADAALTADAEPEPVDPPEADPVEGDGDAKVDTEPASSADDADKGDPDADDAKPEDGEGGEPEADAEDKTAAEDTSDAADTADSQSDSADAADAADAPNVTAAAVTSPTNTNPEAPMPENQVDASAALDAVVASGASNAVPQTPAKAAEPEVEDPGFTITASANVPEFDAGQKMGGVRDISEALTLVAANSFPEFSEPASGPGGERLPMKLHKHQIAKINLDFEDSLVASGDNLGQIMEVMEFAGNEARLSQPLTAAGWCAPSDNVLELCPPASLDGMFDMPEFAVTGGGVNYASGPDFSSLFEAGGIQTEAEAIARTPKDCVTIPCPTWDEERLDAIYLCVKGGLLMRAAFPQWVDGYTSRVLAAHRHRINQYKIGKVIAGSTPLALTTGAFGSSVGDTLERVELVLAGEVEKHRLGLSQTIEVGLSHWVRGLLRADLSKRVGASPDRPVTDADLDAHFASINARVQWLHDFDPLPGAHNATNPTYPDTFRAIIYPGGTWKNATKPVINLSAVYDSTALEVNEYTGLFVEQGNLVLKSGCYDSFILTLPVCNAGRTGASDLTCAEPVTP